VDVNFVSHAPVRATETRTCCTVCPVVAGAPSANRPTGSRSGESEVMIRKVPLERDRERKIKRLDQEIVERICPLCDGVGGWYDEVYCKATDDYEPSYAECARCEGLGVVYAEE
jgi:hypothetical protein